MSKRRYQSIVIYDNGPKEKPEVRFDVDLTWFKSARTAQRDATKADTGTVIGFIPLDVDEPDLQAVMGVIRLAFLYDQQQSTPTKLPVLELLRQIFLAGRTSAIVNP